MKPTVLLFNFNNPTRSTKATAALLPIGVKIKKIKKEDYLQPLGYLAGKEDIEPVADFYTGEELKDEMMLLVNLTSQQIDKVILGLKKVGIGKIKYKAVLTATNQHWTAMALFDELCEEHEMVHAYTAKKIKESKHEKELKEQELKEQELKEQELRDQELKEQEV